MGQRSLRNGASVAYLSGAKCSGWRRRLARTQRAVSSRAAMRCQSIGKSPVALVKRPERAFLASGSHSPSPRHDEVWRRTKTAPWDKALPRGRLSGTGLAAAEFALELGVAQQNGGGATVGAGAAEGGFAEAAQEGFHLGQG